MKYFKSIIIAVVAILFFTAGIYFIFSFALWDMNISHWSVAARAWASFLELIAIFLGSFIGALCYD